MVKQLISLALFFLSAVAGAWAEEVEVSSEIDSETHYENQPVKGLITVTHREDQPVDTKSFFLGSDLLQADLVKQVKISPGSPLVLSFYRFELPGKPKGLYTLPPVSVTVGGKTYRSIASTYSVDVSSSVVPVPPKSAANGASSVAGGEKAPTLKLEALIEGKSTVYPGEQLKVAYRYTYSGSIDLDKESLPLLDAEGFIKIGEKEIVDSTADGTSIRTISQVIEAVKPGDYTFPASFIEGYAYDEGPRGKKAYRPNRLQSEAPAVTIKVVPFPEQDKPASFNGAIGNFSFESSLLSPSEMSVGEEFSLALIVSGKGSLKSVSFANLCCQPGFSGFFQIDDLPPVEEIKGDVKTTVFKMRPMTDRIDAIPTLEFAFFNPETERYTVLRSDPILVRVNTGKLPSPLPEIAAGVVKEEKNGENEPAVSDAAKRQEIGEMMPLGPADLQNLPFSAWWVIALIPIASALLLYQWRLRNYLLWLDASPRTFDSATIFEKAFSTGDGLAWDQHLLKIAFKQALFEAGLIPDASLSDREVPLEGICGEVVLLWDSLDEGRFSGKRQIGKEEAYRTAKPLFEKVRRSEPNEGERGQE